MANDHYVPQFYLKSFQAVTGKVWCYERSVHPGLVGIKKIACREEYYSIKAKHLKGEKRRIDTTIGQLESVSAPLLKELLTINKINLKDIERENLSVFFAHLSSRTPLFREKFKNMYIAFHETMAKISAENKEIFKQEVKMAEIECTPEELEGLRQDVLDIDNRFALRFTEESDDFFLKNELEVVLFIAPILYDKHWHIIESSTSRVFITSDHPIALLPPTNDYPSYKGLGLENAIVALPLSPKRCLLMSNRPGKSDIIKVGRDSVNEVNQYIILHAHKQVFSNLLSKDFQRAFDKTNPEASTKVYVQ